MARSQDDTPDLNQYLGSFFGGADTSAGSPIDRGAITTQPLPRDVSAPTSGGYDPGNPPPTLPIDPTTGVPGPNGSVNGGIVAHGNGPADLNGIARAGTAPSYSDPRSMLNALLAQGLDANTAINQVNSKFGLPSGASLAYYAPGAHGPGSGAVIGLPASMGGGYLALGGDGTWGWNPGDSGGSGGTASGGGGGATTSGGGVGGPTTGFADPAYQQLLNLATQRINALSQPQTFPQLDSYMSMLQANEAQAKQRAQTFADQLSGRISQLQQPLLTDANVVNQRALASNNLLASRDNALAAARADLARRGIDPNSSGLALNQQNTIGQQYGNAQSNIDAQLQSQQIQGDEQRRNEATQLQGLVQQALQGGDVTALQNQAQVADLENQVFNMGQNQAREQLSTAEIPVNLTNQGFANAVNASGSVSNPLNALLSLAMLGNQQQGLQQNAANSNTSALAWLLQQALG